MKNKIKLFENFVQKNYSEIISKKRDTDENWSMYNYEKSDLNDPTFIRSVIKRGTDIEIMNFLSYIVSNKLESKLIPRQSILYYFIQWMINFDRIDLLEKLQTKLSGKLQESERERLKLWAQRYHDDNKIMDSEIYLEFLDNI